MFSFYSTPIWPYVFPETMSHTYYLDTTLARGFSHTIWGRHAPVVDLLQGLLHLNLRRTPPRASEYRRKSDAVLFFFGGMPFLPGAGGFGFSGVERGDTD